MSKFIICLSGNTWYSLDIDSNEFKEEIRGNFKDTYITFQVSDFIRYLKSEDKKYVPNIINLESFDKQFSQSGKDILGHSKWHILKTLRRENIIKEDFKIHQIEPFFILIKDFYEKFVGSNPEEKERFETLELKLNKIIHETQLRGIKIDQEKVENRCEELHAYLYELKNKLQFEFNIFQPENIESQLQYLKSKNYRILDTCKRTVNLLRNIDVVCNLFYEINKTAQNLRSLVFINARFGGKELIHPYFIGFGTITSRIIIKEPSLQNLSKENRVIIIPNNGMKLLYIDYSQYEAGILAHFSKDNKLLKLYNEDDIYTDVVKNVLKKDVTPANRKEAKILFYRYLYGDDFSNNLKTKKIIDSYFNSFKELADFKKGLVEECNKDGHVKSLYGNYRKLNSETENIWILSHFIQSIASYIFKKSIIEVHETVKNARLLIPLHDGALYEVDNINYPQSEEQIKDIFINNLKLDCPSLVNANVEIKDFYSN